MTENEKYTAVMLELGEILKTKNHRIEVLEWQVQDLEKKLAEAEAHLIERKKEGVC